MRTTLEQFFSGKFLKIPAYQRDYAWETDNIDELWDDIDEALRIAVPHYIGTFILAKKPGHTELDVVDGQRRLTTVTMLVRALVERLPEGPERIVLTDQFLARQDRSRLALLGTNEAFFRAIIEGQAVEPATQGQRRLRDGLRHIPYHAWARDRWWPQPPELGTDGERRQGPDRPPTARRDDPPRPSRCRVLRRDR